jgi:transposase-like protein
VGWIEQLQPVIRKRIVGRAPNVRHPEDLKHAAVIELCSRKTSALEIAQKLAVCRPTLYNWKNQVLGPEAATAMRHRKTPLAVPEQLQLKELQQQIDSLERDVRRLHLEHDILKKANELLKKDLGVDLQILSNQEKTLLVDALKHAYTLEMLDLARSTYFYHCVRLRMPDK